MMRTLKTAVVAAGVALGGLSGIAAAHADGSVEIRIGGPGSGIAVERVDAQRWRHKQPDNWNDPDPRMDPPPPRWGDPDGPDARRGPPRWGDRCTADRALDKASRMGVWRARVVDEDRRTITVVGRRDGRRIMLTFARAPRCPLLD